MYKNALISVFDKEGLVECVKSLQKLGTRIVSTGGTAQLLSEHGIPVVNITDQTQFPEVMDGRVKTLHPHVFLPLLARKDHKKDEQELNSRKLEHFDLVICNLYPFDRVTKDQEKEQIELIDVGGPSMLRASAKNFEKITVICDPKDYNLLNQKEITVNQRRKLASKVFDHLSRYDACIANYLKRSSNASSDYEIRGQFFKSLRYGENPQQKSSWYSIPSQKGLHDVQVLHGKELSFNNILDLQAAVSTLREFSTPCFVGIKHNNPCGVACASNMGEAVRKGLKADPMSIFGGIVAVNRKMDQAEAEQLHPLFLECIIAPDYSKEALSLLSTKKNLRLLLWENILKRPIQSEMHKVDGGFLIQDEDQVKLDWSQVIVDGKKPSDSIRQDLEMAWKVCAHLKSNAVSLVSGQQTVGLGMGQVDRVTAVDLAIQRMKKYHPSLSSSVVMASDGFFPFEDSIVRAGEEGIQWIIQPGGSVKDKIVIQKAKELGMNIIRTGCRHFKH